MYVSGNLEVDNSFSQGEETVASGQQSHAQGIYTTTAGAYSHAEGQGTVASGSHSHAEGAQTVASGDGSHSEGRLTVASGVYSHAEGYYTIASGSHQHVQGIFNQTSSAALHIIGNGTSDVARSNILEVYIDSVVVSGSLNVTSGITGSISASSATISTLNATILTGSDAFFANNIRVNGTASIGMLETVSQSSLVVGDKYIVIMSGGVDHAGLDGAGILYGSGSTGPTVDENGANAYIKYRNAYDKLEIYPGLRVSGSITASNGFSGDGSGLTNLPLSGYATLTGVSGTFISQSQLSGYVTNTAATASLARLAAANIFTTNQTISGSLYVSGSINSNILTGSANRVVYTNSNGSLSAINNDYTYNTSNTFVSYKVKISGSAAGLTGSFFITPSDKGYFVPLNCVYMHESGSLSAGTIAAGYTLSTPNDFCNNSSVSLSTLGSFQQISLRTGDGIAKSAPPSTTTKWYLSSGGGTNATGTLCITGFYTNA